MSSKEKILEAAIKVFAEKGRFGAKMEEIAAAAGLNKAMVYYTFQNKDNLYLEVMKVIISDMIGEGLTHFENEIEPKSSYKDGMISHIDFMLENFTGNPSRTKILVDSLANGSAEFSVAVNYCLDHYGRDKTRMLINYIEQGKRNGAFRDIDAEHVFISIIGMVAIFFMAPHIGEMMNIQVGDPEAFFARRKRSIVDMLFNGILAKK
jgi:TetR/AcrR family transcriptional regulator